VVVALEGRAYATCWNPFALGCMPTVVYSHEWNSTGGTVSRGAYSCSANDWGLLPGVAICSGSSHSNEQAVGSVAIMTGVGDSYGRLFAYSGGTSDPSNPSNAYSPNVAVSDHGKAYGDKVAVSGHNEARSAAGGVAISGVSWPYNAYPAPANAYTGPGGVAIAGGRANGGAVAVAGGDATTSSGGVVAVSATGNASGGVVNIDTR
jgi:hypothetical protein